MARILGTISSTFIAFSLILLIEGTRGEVCVKKNPCLCEFNEFSKIDLSKVIHNSTSGQPEPLIDEFNNLKYFYYGCHDGELTLKDKDNGTDVVVTDKGSIIQQNLTVPVKNRTGVLTSLGNSTDIRFNPVESSNTEYELLYEHNQMVVARVRLSCYHVTFIKVLSSNEINNTPEFVLSSPEACVKTTRPGMSTGSIFLLILVISTTVYLIGGALMLYFIRGARGLELIPNIDFWKSLPGLVKDGLIFLLSGCNSNIVATAETYDRI